MATDDSYEIMPYKEIVELKKQIAELQRKTGDTSSQELLNSMAALTKSMNNMLQLFSSAAEEMKLEEKTEGELAEKVAPLIEKVNRLEEQNKTIAEGLVAIADMVKDIKRGERTREIKPRYSPPVRAAEMFGEDLPPLEPPEFPFTEPTELPPLEPPELQPLEPPAPTRPIPPPFSSGSPRVVPRRPMPQGGMPPGPMPMYGAPYGFGSLPPLPPLEEPEKRKGMFGLFKKK